MQDSVQDENTVDRAFQIAGSLPDSLGPAARLLILAVDDGVDWNIEGFSSMDREKAWSTSIMTHLLGFLGAAGHQQSGYTTCCAVFHSLY